MFQVSTQMASDVALRIVLLLFFFLFSPPFLYMRIVFFCTGRWEKREYPSRKSTTWTDLYHSPYSFIIFFFFFFIFLPRKRRNEERSRNRTLTKKKKKRKPHESIFELKNSKKRKAMKGKTPSIPQACLVTLQFQNI
eukprot:TRINITY_DN285_c5_g1_i1.p1 TRINITY_DN285_c5_g1~~TRINITY_DN285_c5_g1_i1.p1  ORF type:complete len:137 (-),score=3.81 TRINITY_DN285_c5_g1_i1:178-588(-)